LHGSLLLLSFANARSRGRLHKKEAGLAPGFLHYKSQKILAAGAAFFALIAGAAGAHIALFGLRAARAGRLFHVA
jgi:hypothetical protein